MAPNPINPWPQTRFASLRFASLRFAHLMITGKKRKDALHKHAGGYEVTTFVVIRPSTGTNPLRTEEEARNPEKMFDGGSTPQGLLLCKSARCRAKGWVPVVLRFGRCPTRHPEAVDGKKPPR